MSSKALEPCNLESLPFSDLDYVPDFIECRPDIPDKIKLLPIKVKVTNDIVFEDRILPKSNFDFVEASDFPRSYYVDLHLAVKAFNTSNYNGARIPLKYNNINVEKFRAYLSQFNYPHQHILQYIEFGFPLGLWTDAYLVPCTKNHSSSYSYFTFIDKFISDEILKSGLTGPFTSSPFNDIMLSPLMTAHKKPSSRRAVFDASFGLYSLNKNTPEKIYHEEEYEFTFPRIDDLIDIISKLGRGCYLFKRVLSRYFLQLKIDPFEYDRLGFIWRKNVYFFVSFVWGCRHAGYCGQWVSSAVSFIHSYLGVELKGEFFNVLNYADDFAGAEHEFDTALLSFNTLGKLLVDLGLIEAVDKACPPSKIMTYLGVKFDTQNM